MKTKSFHFNQNPVWTSIGNLQKLTYRTRRLGMVVVFLISIVQQVCAYPITPQTLRKLISRSQYIVIALIDNPDKPEKYFDPKVNDTLELFSFGGDGLADLNIKEILKGKPDNMQHIAVSYEAGMICPAPPFYPDKKMVIAFLGKEDSSKTYFTYGLSYGSKVIDSEKELNSFKARIVEYIDILKIRNKRKQKLATVEWLVKCSEDKFTRWEGAYELSRKGDFMSYYDRSKDEQFFKIVNKSQLKRIDSSFFATDTIGYSEICLSNLISKDHYPQLKQHLLKSLALSDYYVVNDIMKKIIEIYPNQRLYSIYEEVVSLSYDDKEKEAKQRQLIEKFKTEAE